MQRREISLDEKLRYLKEIESIHRLSKKVLPPAGTTWARIADKHLKRALGMQIEEPAEALNMRRGRQMHQHSPRTARVIERTLRNGVIHPDVLHSYRNDARQRVSVLRQAGAASRHPGRDPLRAARVRGSLVPSRAHAGLRLRAQRTPRSVSRPARGQRPAGD